MPWEMKLSLGTQKDLFNAHQKWGAGIGTHTARSYFSASSLNPSAVTAQYWDKSCEKWQRKWTWAKMCPKCEQRRREPQGEHREQPGSLSPAGARRFKFLGLEWKRLCSHRRNLVFTTAPCRRHWEYLESLKLTSGTIKYWTSKGCFASRREGLSLKAKKDKKAVKKCPVKR